MVKLPKKMLFAVEAVLDIAYHAGASVVQSTDITRRQNIPHRYLEQALQALVRDGVLIGVRGPRGGYRLARERRRISVGDIVRAIGGQEDGDDTNGGAANSPAAGSDLGRRVLLPLWDDLQRDTMAKLDGVSIDELCGRADTVGIASQGRDSLDFSI
jgi:Rrf2 family iron-sulfur cluster assembly transcriptional regulator